MTYVREAWARLHAWYVACTRVVVWSWAGISIARREWHAARLNPLAPYDKWLEHVLAVDALRAKRQRLFPVPFFQHVKKRAVLHRE